jgi:DNA-binding HxlR family transcriptional regulator
MKARRSTATNIDTPIASTMMHEDPMTKVRSIPSTEATLTRCPINNTFNIENNNMINSKQNRFNQLLNSIDDGNPKTLSVRLREMEKHGLIKRKVYSNEKLVRVEYRPTEKGLALQTILDTMAAYSLKYCSKDVLKDGKPREFKDTPMMILTIVLRSHDVKVVL